MARVARAVLLPGALFRAGAFALPPCAPKSYMRPLPHLEVSENCEMKHWNFRGPPEFTVVRLFCL